MKNFQKDKAFLAAKNDSLKKKYETLHQKVSDFRLKNHVKVICCFQDFHFWNGQTGHIIKIRPDALYPITVKFDEMMTVELRNGNIYCMESFNFKPDDIITFKKLRDYERKIDIERQLIAVKKTFS